LRRLAEGAQECPAHLVAIAETGLPRDGFDRVPALLHERARRFHAQVLHGGEVITIPGLHADEWTRWEADRRELSKKFGNAKPADRYGVKSSAAA